MDKQGDYVFIAAAATEDGENLDVHFGRASNFKIYGIDENDDARLIGERKVTPVCRGGFHLTEDMKKNAEAFSDCDYVIAQRIGAGAADALESAGVSPMELSGNIEDALDKVIMYRKVQNLFN